MARPYKICFVLLALGRLLYHMLGLAQAPFIVTWLEVFGDLAGSFGQLSRLDSAAKHLPQLDQHCALAYLPRGM